MQHRALRLLRLILLLLVAISFCESVNAQQLIFCEKVDRDGHAIKQSSYFIIRPSGSTVQALVTFPKPLQLNEATIDIYQIGSQGKEQFESTVKIPVQPDWQWFVQPLRFYRKGTYNVYVYGDNGRLLGVSTVKIDVR